MRVVPWRAAQGYTLLIMFTAHNMSVIPSMHVRPTSSSHLKYNLLVVCGGMLCYSPALLAVSGGMLCYSPPVLQPLHLLSVSSSLLRDE